MRKAMNAHLQGQVEDRVCHAQIFAAYVPVRSEFFSGAEDGLDFLEELMAAVAAASPAGSGRAACPGSVPAAAETTGRLAAPQAACPGEADEVKPPDSEGKQSAARSRRAAAGIQDLRELADSSTS